MTKSASEVASLEAYKKRKEKARKRKDSLPKAPVQEGEFTPEGESGTGFKWEDANDLRGDILNLISQGAAVISHCRPLAQANGKLGHIKRLNEAVRVLDSAVTETREVAEILKGQSGPVDLEEYAVFHEAMQKMSASIVPIVDTVLNDIYGIQAELMDQLKETTDGE